MAIVRITCPACTFSRELPAEKVPDRPVQVTCPRCKGSFPFSKREVNADLPQASVAPAHVDTTCRAAAVPPPIPDRDVVPPPPPKSTPHPPAQRSPRPGAPPPRTSPVGRPEAENGSRLRTIRLVILVLLLACTIVYALREKIPYQKMRQAVVPTRQVITIPPPTGTPPALSAENISIRVSPGSAPGESGSSPSSASSPPSGSRFEPFDFYIFIFAVNAPGKVRVNGQEYKEIKNEPDMQYSINAFGDPFRYGSNTIEFNLDPQRGGNRHFAPELKMQVFRKIGGVGGERRTIGEWRLSDKDGWQRSVTLEIPEVPAP